MKRCAFAAIGGAILLSASVAGAGSELPVDDDPARLLLGGTAPPATPAVSLDSAEPLVDWPEPDRTPPTIMSSRLSLGVLGSVGSPLGTGALEAELYPWNQSFLTVGFHAAYGPWGALGPSVSEGISLDLSLGRSVQWGMGVGFAQSFHRGPTAVAAPGLPDWANFIDEDIGHLSIFLSRTLMLRAGAGLAGPIGGCKEPFGPGSGTCGRWSPLLGSDLTASASLFWSFDLGPGDH